ncbi:MAG: zinc metallopeptidase [bacterium]
MHWLILIFLLAILILGPQLWVQWILNRHNRIPEVNFGGNGSELARYLLDKMSLQSVGVEITEQGDHYDPQARVVRLTKDKYEGKTLTAITVAAHEVGHAIQHAAGEPMFEWRTRLAIWAAYGAKIGSFLLFLVPLLPLLTKVPIAAAVPALAAFLILGTGLVVQLLTLPVEVDASFKKALPLLEAGILTEEQQRPARNILRAAAMTYVAGALAGLLNFWRWLQVFRR